MPKKRRYGEAWKDVQIDVEQSDAVFERFFRQTPQPTKPEVSAPLTTNYETTPKHEDKQVTTISLVPPPAESEIKTRPKAQETKTPQTPPAKKLTQGAPAVSKKNTDIQTTVSKLRKQIRLSRGEAAILRFLLRQAKDKASENECYAKIPNIAEDCDLTHRGCQLALKSLQARGLINRIKSYDPTDRLGIKFSITLPFAK